MAEFAEEEAAKPLTTVQDRVSTFVRMKCFENDLHISIMIFYYAKSLHVSGLLRRSWTETCWKLSCKL